MLTHTCAGFVVPLSAAKPASSLQGVSLPVASDGVTLDLGAELGSSTGKTLLIMGTHAADFNTVEYAQRVRAFMPRLREQEVDRFLMVINGDASQCVTLAKLLDLPSEIILLADPKGEAGRKFGVSRGFRPDDTSLSPFLKLFAMGIGIGPPWMTLPAVLRGYLGSPNGKRAWVEAALKQGQEADRWPAILEFNSDGSIASNKFDDTPLISGWGLRPFELATLRLQNLIGVQGQNWDALKPVDDRCLTQLGGCAVVGRDGEPLYAWIDGGLCDVPDFDELLEAI